MSGPDPGEAVGLQFEPDGTRSLALAVTSDALVEAQQVLDVVPVLVRDDIRLGERATLRPEARAQVLVEAEIDEHGLVGRAVERADRGGGRAASGVRLAAEEARRRFAVAVHLFTPVRLDAVDDADDPAVLTLVRVTARPARGGELARGRRVVRPEREGIGAAVDIHAEQREYDDHQDRARPATHGEAAAAARAAVILHLTGVEPGPWAEAHFRQPSRAVLAVLQPVIGA